MDLPTQWTDFPVEADQDVHDYKWFIQYWRALQERSCAVGGTFLFPDTNYIHESGTISSGQLVDNLDGTFTLTQPSKDWSTLPHVSCTGKRWVGLSCSLLAEAWHPASYDVILNSGSLDETQIVRCQITDNTAHTLTFLDAPLDWVTAGFIPNALSFFHDTQYVILKRGQYSEQGRLKDGLWWHDRWPAFPNDFTYEQGTLTTATTSTLTDVTKKWNTDQFAGLALLVYSNDYGHLKRVTIVSNTEHTLTFAMQTWTPDGQYIIVDEDGNGFPERKGGFTYPWYNGYQKAYYSHNPQDSINDLAVGFTYMPELYAYWNHIDDPLTEDCDDPDTQPVQHDAFDRDVWSDANEICGAPTLSDKPYSPFLYMTLRQCQVQTEGICPAFVSPLVNYDGSSFLNNYSVATLFFDAGINLVGTDGSIDATADSMGDVTWTFTVPEGAEALYYQVFDDDGKAVPNIPGINYQGSINASSGSLNLNVNAANHGKSYMLIGSWGWTRYVPKEFRYAYPCTAFLPDINIDPDTGEIEAIDPPRIDDFEETGCHGNGGWDTREASDSYKTHTTLGFVEDSGETYDAWVEGDLARYSGDNWNDPSVIPHSSTGSETAGALAPYWDHYNQSKRDPTEQASYERGLKGEATGGDTWYLRDTSKDWWAIPFGQGTLRTSSRNATSGSGTTLVDEGIDPDEGACWYTDGRNVYKGFILEVDKAETDENGDPITVTYKVPITDYTYSDPAFTFTFPSYCGLTVVAGDVYRVKEPKYILNRWQIRNLIVRKPDGTKFRTYITHSDKDTLFFEQLPDGLTIEEGDVYEIQELTYGGVYRFTETEPDADDFTPFVRIAEDKYWVQATGADGREGGGQDFKNDPTCNLPDYFKRYGRLMKGDYVGIKLFNELYGTINLLRWTREGMAWTRNGELNGWTLCRELPHTVAERSDDVGSNYDPYYDAYYNEDGSKFYDEDGSDIAEEDVAARAGGGGSDPCKTACPSCYGFVTLPMSWSDLVSCTSCGWTNGSAVAAPATPLARASAVIEPESGALAGDPDPHCMGVVYSLAKEREYGYGVVNVRTCLPSTVEFYAYAEPVGVFDANGDDVIENAWSLVDTDGPNDDATRMSVKVGQNSPEPTTPATPTADTAHCATGSTARGYLVTNQAGIAKWEFTYLDPIE